MLTSAPTPLPDPAPAVELAPAPLPTPARPLVTQASPVKFGRILDEEGGSFAFEYDDTRGQKNRMRLDAFTYEGAIHEARSYLGIQDDDRDEDGNLWAVE